LQARCRHQIRAAGQHVNSLWMVLVALAAFAVAYRFYSAFLAARVGVLDNSRPTPAHRLRDGVDYHPTNKYVLFGHHFAAIAGPGPLIGPVLARPVGVPARLPVDCDRSVSGRRGPRFHRAPGLRPL